MSPKGHYSYRLSEMAKLREISILKKGYTNSHNSYLEQHKKEKPIGIILVDSVCWSFCYSLQTEGFADHSCNDENLWPQLQHDANTSYFNIFECV